LGGEAPLPGGIDDDRAVRRRGGDGAEPAAEPLSLVAVAENDDRPVAGSRRQLPDGAVEAGLGRGARGGTRENDEVLVLPPAAGHERREQRVPVVREDEADPLGGGGL